MSILPPRLGPGSHIRVIAPSGSLAVVGDADRRTIDRRMADLGFDVTFGVHAWESGPFGTGPLAGRLADFHDAFADPSVDGILTVVGGHHANELLPGIDWRLVEDNPKVLCGYSDITALQAAILARTGLVTYSGPHWATFGMQYHFDGIYRAFVDCVCGDTPFTVAPSSQWFDDRWWEAQTDRWPEAGKGWWVLQPGSAAGRIVGGNLCTLNLLQGTTDMPSLDGALLFVEDDFESGRPNSFRRDLASLLQLPDARRITGVAIGRFQRASGMTRPLLAELVGSLPQLEGLPIVANVDFGHTFPLATFPIGGEAVLELRGPNPFLVITRH
jgi:muramoyltetrapeptide carboxypeptidase LdcA involved in peptidoglycan recycling